MNISRKKNIKNLIIVFSMMLGFISPITLLAAGPATVNLGTAGNYVILSKTQITTTGVTAITGDIAVSPAAATFIEGFGLILDGSGTFSTSSLVTGNVYAADYTAPTPATLTTAVSAMEAAYTDASGRPTPDGTDLYAGIIGGQTFTPGLYKWTTGVTIPTDVTLSGGASDIWIFQIDGNLNISSTKSILLSGGALPANIFWAVAGTTTLQTTSTFEGNILAGPATSTIAMQNGATLHGRALGQKEVTLIANTISATDMIAPTLTITDDEAGIANITGGDVTYTFTFSETVTLFATGDVTVAGGTKGAFTPVSGTVYTLVVTPNASSTTNITVDVAAVVAIDVASNPNSAASQSVQAVDTVAPTVAVTMDDSALNIGDTALVTFTFSEAPTGFATDDVTVANGSIGAIDSSNSLIQTATYTPTNGILDTINVISVGTVWTDTALNTGVGGSSPNYSIDTIAPTVTVTMNDVTLTVGDSALVTFTFSEAPTGFTIADVTGFPNGILSGFTSTIDPLIYTTTFTPNASIDDTTNVITVGTAWTDAASNAGITGNSPNYTINTLVSGGIANNHITIIKQVVNDSGGTAVYTDFPLFINGNRVNSGESIAFAAGIYTVTETNLPGYVRTFTGNCNASGIINHGGIDTHNDICTIVNNDIGATVPVVPPLIDVVKVPSPLVLPAGPGPVTYTYTLRNIGVVPVTNITMVGDTCSPIVLASGDMNTNAILEVSETWIYRCSTTLSKTHTNIVTTTGWANGINAVDIASATVVVGLPIVPPLIHITKIPNLLTLLSGPDFVTYTEKVTNPGLVALSSVKVTDDKCNPVNYLSGDTNNNALLETTETWTYTCKVKLTKTTTNTAIATGTANDLTATDFALATVVVSTPFTLRLPNTGFPPKKYYFLEHFFDFLWKIY